LRVYLTEVTGDNDSVDYKMAADVLRTNPPQSMKTDKQKTKVVDALPLFKWLYEKKLVDFAGVPSSSASFA
jgi:hypothetical protein